MKTKHIFLVLIFLIHANAEAQLFCEPTSATGGNPPQSNAMLDAIIIWVAVIIVLATLFMSIKFLIKPEEKDPKHIKNITRDEGF